MSDGWIKWSSGDCPIKSDKTVVEVQWQTGDIDQHVTLDTGFAWERTNDDMRYRIIAYRIVEDHEPMPPTRKELTAQIKALRERLAAMGPVLRRWYGNGHTFTKLNVPHTTHYFDIETINGVPYIHGIAMKEVEK